jgi:putative ABC transport system ATP-binding protein
MSAVEILPQVQIAPVLIELANVSKTFLKGRLPVNVLTNIQFCIRQGEFIALMGPSGSGKSTLLNLISGLDQPSSGSISFRQQSIEQLSDRQLAAWRARSIGFVFQNYQLLPVLTAAENVELPLLLKNMSRRERQQRVINALKIVGLDNRADHLPAELSGGQEQRVSIARALVTDPEFLVCDEPTGNLDSKTGQDILGILQSLQRDFGKTILMVTHDATAAGFASRVVRLQDGQIKGGV